MRLAYILALILITSLLHVLIYRLSVFLLLLRMLVYHLLGGLNCLQGITVHRVGFLERSLDFHIDAVVVGKELL